MIKKLKLINLYGPPGTGKSTTAAGLFFLMKSAGYSVELITEAAKERVYEGHLGCLSDQIYIFGEQQRRSERLKGQVEYAITDSPLILSILYNKDLSFTFNNLVKEVYDGYENINIYINRVKPYVKIGRSQEEHESDLLGENLIKLLTIYNIGCITIDGDKYAPESIFNIINKEKFITEE